MKQNNVMNIRDEAKPPRTREKMLQIQNIKTSTNRYLKNCDVLQSFTPIIRRKCSNAIRRKSDLINRHESVRLEANIGFIYARE